MYIRYQSFLYDGCSRGQLGLFQTAGTLVETGVSSWHQSEIKREFDWFNENLGFPHRLFYRPRRKGEISGLCWFRASAIEYVSRARYLAWLLNDVGVFIEERTSRAPGRVLWQDTHQIVAVAWLQD